MELTIEPINVDGMSWSLKFPGRGEERPWDWLHFDLVHAQAKTVITKDAMLPEFARHLVTGADENPRILTDGNAVAGVVPAYARTGESEEDEIVCWHFAMVPGRLVTGRRHFNRTLVDIYESANASSQPSCPAALIDRRIAEFAREVRSCLSKLHEDLDVVEDALIGDREETRLADLGSRLGLARREATRLKRALSPLARALHEQSDEFPEWAKPDGHDTAERGLHDALDDIVALHDRSRSLHDELTTRMTEETNRRLYIVSLVTTLLLPATFVTGFFGMNTGGLLWAGDAAPFGTAWAAMVCVFAVVVTLLLLRWKRLL